MSGTTRVFRIRRSVVVEGERVGEWNWMICDSCLTEIETLRDNLNCPHCNATFHYFCFEALRKSKGRCPKCRIEIE